MSRSALSAGELTHDHLFALLDNRDELGVLSIFVDAESPPDATLAVAEPRLTERLVERCLETGARVTPVHGEAAEALVTMGGIAARLRW